jgi:hypothetical protein
MTLALGERDLWLAGLSGLVASIALTLAFGMRLGNDDRSATFIVAAVK